VEEKPNRVSGKTVPPTTVAPTTMTANSRTLAWGPWATALWSVAIMAAFVLIQAIFFSLYVAARMKGASATDIEQAALQLRNNGDVIAMTTLVTTALCVPMVLAVARLKRGVPIDAYLPTALPPSRVLVRWLVVAAIFLFASDMLSLVTEHPVVPDLMKEAYDSTEAKPLLWVALVLAAPLFEETLFRGFMIAGFSRSWLGYSGAVLLTSLAWALIHFQYGAYEIIIVFAFGILLGSARVKTGSLATPYLIHAVANAVATMEAALSLSGS
jgi:CAAX protease family protein